MSRVYRFRVVNVFAESRLAGNPLAVIENADSLSDAEMQQIALQFNLSETTFILAIDWNAPDRSIADAQVRIFTPGFEMPFAGHPTLGTAHVLRALGRAGDALRLQMKAGIIPVTARGDVWTLTAKPPAYRNYEFSSAEIATALGLQKGDIAAAPMWIDAGVEQLIVSLASTDAVARAAPRTDLCVKYCGNFMEAQAYVFARRDEHSIVSRYFFHQGGAMIEDPGTGSACANLGAYLLAADAQVPLRLDVHQGTATGRPCLLHLDVDTGKHIRVGGRVIELMRGELQLD